MADEVVVLEEFYDGKEVFGRRKVHWFVGCFGVKYVDELVEESEDDNQFLLWWLLLENGGDFLDALLWDNVIEFSDILGHVLQDKSKAILHFVKTKLSDIFVENTTDSSLDLC